MSDIDDVGGLVVETAAREEVAWRYDAAQDADTRLRYQIVLLAGEGRDVAEIAAVVRRSTSTVWRVLHRYRAGGPDTSSPSRAVASIRARGQVSTQVINAGPPHPHRHWALSKRPHRDCAERASPSFSAARPCSGRTLGR